MDYRPSFYLSKFLNIDNFRILCYNIVNNNTIGDDILKRLITIDNLTDVFGMANLNPLEREVNINENTDKETCRYLRNVKSRILANKER